MYVFSLPYFSLKRKRKRTLSEISKGYITAKKKCIRKDLKE